MESSFDASGKTIVVVPAFNAARTLADVVTDIPADCYDAIVVVDDASRDETVAVAEALDVTLIRHARNRGYGGNLKTCYAQALELGAEYVVTVHADNQYDPRMIPAALRILELGICDVVLGNRIRTRQEALAGGMPRLKYFANRALTLVENTISGQNLGEWHSGFRACRREVLERVPFEANSEDFVFDSQFLLQAVHLGFRVGDLPIPVRYFPEASSISVPRAAKYALETMLAFAEWVLHRSRVRPSVRFEPRVGSDDPHGPPSVGAESPPVGRPDSVSSSVSIRS